MARMANPARVWKEAEQDTHAIGLLMAEHEHIREIAAELRRPAQGRREERRSLFQELFSSLEVHMRVEEEILYPAIHAESDREGREQLWDALEEHRLMRAVVDEMRGIPVEEARWEERLLILIEKIERHFRKEEESIFPDAEVLLEEELDRLGIQIQARSEQLQPR
jgi:iron-sulfur cluster repair protein YtfE (RIC family)